MADPRPGRTRHLEYVDWYNHRRAHRAAADIAPAEFETLYDPNQTRLTQTATQATRYSSERYERQWPGELIHLDVKKIGPIPEGGGWRANGRPGSKTSATKKARIGYDYVHAAVDDHTRLAYAEILPDEKGATGAVPLRRLPSEESRRGLQLRGV